jgi:hypothetical protein
MQSVLKVLLLCLCVHVRSCFGNLEQVHNDIHNIMGGTGGEMA